MGPDRWATWARLKVKASGREFYTVAAHFPLGNSSLVVEIENTAIDTRFVETLADSAPVKS